MATFKEMTKIKDRVRLLLESRKDARDSDNLLISLFWYYEQQEGIESMSAVGFLTLLSKGKLTSSESIRRMRQKLQEEFPSLRGSSYKERKEEEKTVRENINKQI